MVSDYNVNENVFATTESITNFTLELLLIVLVIYLLALGLVLANYIMTSLALYKIADRRNIPNPWMAWLPFTSDWLIGNIVDDYDGRNGIKRKWRVVLLTLSLVAVGGFVISYVALIVGAIFTALQFANTAPDESIISFMVIAYIFLVIVAMIGTALGFCRTVCIYKIYESTVPEKAVKYLLLYLLVPLAGAICLLKCKDKGYPYPVLQEDSAETFETIQEIKTVVGEPMEDGKE